LTYFFRFYLEPVPNSATFDPKSIINLKIVIIFTLLRHNTAVPFQKEQILAKFALIAADCADGSL